MPQSRGAALTGGQGNITLAAASPTVTGALDDDGLYPDWSEVIASTSVFQLGSDANNYPVIAKDIVSVPPTLTLKSDYPTTQASDDDWIVVSDFSPNANLPLANQSDAHFADINRDQMLRIDALLFGNLQSQGSVIDKTNTVPGGPSDLDAYLIFGVPPTGLWFGFQNYLTYWDNGNSVWVFTAPVAGMYVWVTDESKHYIYEGSAWVAWPALAAFGNIEDLDTAFTAGSIPFSDGSNLAQDNTNLYWDDANNRLGLKNTTPETTLDIHGNYAATGNWYMGGDSAYRAIFIDDRSGGNLITTATDRMGELSNAGIQMTLKSLNNHTLCLLNDTDKGIIVLDGDGDVTIDGELAIQLYSQDAEPTLSADGMAAFWKDTNDSNKIYLLFRRGSGDHVKIELV